MLYAETQSGLHLGDMGSPPDLQRRSLLSIYIGTYRVSAVEDLISDGPAPISPCMNAAFKFLVILL